MTARDRLRLSVLATPFPMGGLVGPGNTSFGIDISACDGAPGDELIRIDVSAMDDKAARLSIGFSLLGAFLPSVIGSGEQVLVCHDLENSGVILASMPRDAQNSSDEAVNSNQTGVV